MGQTMGRVIEADKAGMLEAMEEILAEYRNQAENATLQRERYRARGAADAMRRAIHMIRDWEIKPEGDEPEPADLPEVPYQMLDDARTAFNAERNPRVGLVAALTAANLWDLEYFRIAQEAFQGSGIGDTTEKALIRALRAVLKEVKERERV